MDTTKVLHVVFDRYNQMSIKSASRTERHDGCSPVFTMKDEAPIPGQAMALNIAANKEQLIRLLVLTSCQRFASSCYGQFSAMPLENMRAQMFTRKIVGKRWIPSKLCNLPPTSPAFKLHCQQAHLQTALWKGDGNDAPPNLDPKQFRWLLTGNVLGVDQLSQHQDIAPPSVPGT